jgi:hypothetical protein
MGARPSTLGRSQHKWRLVLRAQDCAQNCAGGGLDSLSCSNAKRWTPHSYYRIGMHKDCAKVLILPDTNLRDQGVGGSNPLSPTIIFKYLNCTSGFPYIDGVEIVDGHVFLDFRLAFHRELQSDLPVLTRFSLPASTIVLHD